MKPLDHRRQWTNFAKSTRQSSSNQSITPAVFGLCFFFCSSVRTHCSSTLHHSAIKVTSNGRHPSANGGDRGTCFLTSLGAWPYGEWRQRCQLAPSPYLTLLTASSPIWLPTDAESRISWLMPLWLRPSFWSLHSLASFVLWTRRCWLSTRK